MKKVLIIDKPHPLLEERLERSGYQLDRQYEASRESLAERVSDCFGIVVRSRIRLDADFLSRARQLAFIARYGVGTEHIDLEYAANQNIRVFTSPEGSRDTVAEHTVGLLLMLMNHLGRADRQIRGGAWIREANRATELLNKTVGILGYGNMGQAFARRLQGFDVRTLAYDKYRTGYGDQWAEAVDLATLWLESDVLSIHIPYETGNHYFVDGRFLDRFAKPVFVVNTARGLVLHTADLLDRLQTGQVKGAALDVLEYEEGSFAKLALAELPQMFRDLLQLDNVVLAPHIAGWSHESKKRHAEVLANKIATVYGGGPDRTFTRNQLG